MTRFFYIIGFLTLTACASAQVWDQMPEALMLDQVRLNEKFIKANGIGRVEIIHQQKASNRPIVSSDLVETFLFDSEGKILSATEQNGQGEEMKSQKHHYEKNGLAAITIQTGNSAIQKRYIRDEAGLAREESWLSWEVSESRDTTLLKSLRVETSYWNDTTEVAKYRYADGRPINQVKRVSNQLGYLLQVHTRYAMGARTEQVDFSYTDEGLVAEVVFAKNGTETERRYYTYDALGLVIAIDVRKNEKEQRYEYVYDDAHLPKAILHKDGDVVVIKKYIVTKRRDMPSSYFEANSNR